MRPTPLVLFLAACAGSGRIALDDSADTAGTDDTDAPCTATVGALDPLDGATNVSVTTDLVATFTAPVDTGDYAMSIEGVAGAITVSGDGLTAAFLPNQPLAPSTTYVAHASACSAIATTTFTTAPPATGASQLEGRTYAIAGSDITIVRPTGAAAFLGSVRLPWLLLHVVDVDEAADTITLSGSLGTGTTTVTQDCVAPFDFGTADFAGNPVIDAGPADLTFPIQGIDVTIEAATVGAVFIDDGDTLSQIRIVGTLDTRQIDPIAPVDVCNALQLLPNADHCTACASDGAIECLPFDIVATHADWVEGLVYDPELEPGVDCTP